jgi:hypothetical protein
MNRRNFLATVPLAFAANAIPATRIFGENFLTHSSAMPSQAGTKSSAPAAHELDFATALEAAEAIRNRKISSVELTQRMFARFDRYNPQLNAFAYQLREQAVAQAKKADEALSPSKTKSTQTHGVFHGVPITVKESFAVEGHPCTWGIPELKDSKAPKNSDVVSDLLNKAGAVLLGATNVPLQLADWQSYNAIYGQTNNPWDLKRTPGGSSGGSARGRVGIFKCRKRYRRVTACASALLRDLQP